MNQSLNQMIMEHSSFILIAAAVTGFVATSLAVIGSRGTIQQRYSFAISWYEKLMGDSLYRLFLPITVSRFFVYHLLTIFGCVTIGCIAVERQAIGAMLGLAVGVALPRLYISYLWKRRIVKIDEQVDEALIYMANSFKANPALPSAIKDVCEAMPEPISQEFRVVLKEYQLGTPLDRCLKNLSLRMPAKNLKTALSTLLVGRSVGGNIPKTLEDIASSLRESYRLERMIDAQTAQGKMQAWVMGLMPMFVIVVFNMIDPALIQPLFKTFPGFLILGAAATFNIVGIAFILKVVHIKV